MPNRPAKPITPTQSAFEHPSAHEQTVAALTKRYLPVARNDIRVRRAAGHQPCRPHEDEQFAAKVAKILAADALRHGVREDLAPALQVAA